MVAELATLASSARSDVGGNLRLRTVAAGEVKLRGARLTLQTPRDLLTSLVRSAAIFGFWTWVIFACAIGSVVIYSMATADGSPTGAAAQPTEMQQLAGLLQQVLQEQQQQRVRMDELGQAVQTTGTALHGTQQTTEQVIAQVVERVQTTIQQEQQDHQGAVNQLAQAVQTLQTQVQAIPTVAADQLNQIGQAVQQMQGQMQQSVSADQLQQMGQAMQSLQSQVQQLSMGGAAAVQPPPAPSGSPQAASPPGAPPPTFQFGGAQMGGGGFGLGSMTGSGVSPAVAYAIQQGGVDSRQLGKPSTYDPVNAKVSFQDWSDSIITLADSTMPGIYECLEWIVTAQPRNTLDLSYLKVKFPMMDQTLLAYAESNVYGMLSTYTSGEARSLVRQARRPNGMEAFRLLQIRFNPVTIGRQRAQLMKIANPQENIPLDKLAAEIVVWENRIVDYEARPGAERVSEQMKMAAMIHMAPAKLREHLQLNAGRFSNYVDLREEIFSYLDQVAPVSQTTMDINAVDRTKGCFNCGGPHLARDCPQSSKGGKSKGKGPKGKGGKDGQKGKGKGKIFGKDGKGKKGGKVGKSVPTCSNCGKAGHDYNACWSKPKALNSVDPRLAQMQSQYAKAALEDFKKISGAVANAPAAPVIQMCNNVPRPPSQPTSPSSTQAPSSSTAHVGSLLVRSLCALSRRAMELTETIFGQSAASVVQTHLSRLVTSPAQVLVTLDSGAAASVCPEGVFDQWPQEEGEAGLSFQAADGSVVPELYKVRPLVVTDEGQYRQTQFSVANVNKVLMSATQVANRGHRIVLQPYYMESYIEDIATGDRMALYQQDGVYVQRLTHVTPGPTEGFTGPAPDYVPSVL